MILEIKPIFHALCRSKVGALLLLIQIAITTAIVSNAAFIIQDRVTYLNQETGYPEDEILAFHVMHFGKDVQSHQQFELDETMLRAIPGVKDAVYINNIPLSGSGSSSDFSVNSAPEPGLSARTAYFFTDDHAINTLGVELVAGRNFTQDDIVVTNDNDQRANVTIVTQALLNELFPGENGLGKTIFLGDIPLKVVGVIKHAKGPWLKDSRPNNIALIPYINPNISGNFLVRTASNDRAEIAKQIEDEMLKNYNKRVIIRIRGLDQDKAQYMAEDTLMMRMLVVLITILLLVTALGIFGLTLFNISKRTKQIGTRRALGARKSAIINYFLVENALICIAGLVLGVIAALVLGQLLMQHFSIAALPLGYVAATAIMVFIMSLLAVLGPAKRAANISPSIATRTI
ncbi:MULTISPECIES: FtsX-like permease family protein [unclassified Pseudoalteromonas]|uniref:ABC transporter permease n=1 Tax=unclassified Pseudoalteromonas TaxID=194690 RepID=UPI0009EA6068|nr:MULTISPECIES: FtsX-like permease family protein [unclassified Pseudoalteromonas]MBW4965491.1 ABC transporter permease [Pseudoalteromonas sp. CR1]TMN76864.1 cell division protein FtsX [Pseudoalteromonas sp. S410]TMN88025.1 cell division protein FtsX [Pseudoalteromonas sp. S408]TMN95443.1 cell division protein FtsX [Pseudoalteromonas sp. S407]TMO01707.1 cell division protein FtsX [Pseudoalteromonas sp. S409]